MTPESDAQELVPATFEASFDHFDDTILGGNAPVVDFDRSTEEMEAVFDVPVKVKAVLGGARVQVGELLQMRSGSVVELDRRVGEPVDVFVNDRFIARGELVLIDGSLGVTLTEIVKQDG
jgi:flagellar motor switch protein FliN/FliY